MISSELTLLIFGLFLVVAGAVAIIYVIKSEHINDKGFEVGITCILLGIVSLILSYAKYENNKYVLSLEETSIVKKYEIMDSFDKISNDTIKVKIKDGEVFKEYTAKINKDTQYAYVEEGKKPYIVAQEVRYKETQLSQQYYSKLLSDIYMNKVEDENKAIVIVINEKNK